MNQQQFCAHCGKGASFACGECQQVYYCGHACYNEHPHQCISHKFRTSSLQNPNVSDADLYELYSRDTDFVTGFEAQPDALYGTMASLQEEGRIHHGLVSVKMPFWGLIQKRPKKTYIKEDTTDWDEWMRLQPGPHAGEQGYKGLIATNRFDIAYTQIQNHDSPSAPVILMHHGVPANRLQQLPVAKRLALLGYNVVLVDFLGMGQSDKPLFAGESRTTLEGILEGTTDTTQLNGYQRAWQWQNDVVWVEQVMETLYSSGRKFYYAADDWGAGPAFHYAARYGSSRLLGLILWDPIALDGYPVHEIQAIGRAATGPAQAATAMAQIMGKSNDVAVKNGLEQLFFQMGMAAADQTMTQVYKTMVANPDRVYNQYSLRTLALPYASAHYVQTLDGEVTTSASMTLKFHALRVLAQRSSILSSALLLPYHPQKNPQGVSFRGTAPGTQGIDVPTLIMWGAQDNMMPETQRWRLSHMIPGPTTHIRVQGAGHFAAVDQPDQVAENILMWLKTLGDDALNGPCFGFTGIWKSDEKWIKKHIR